MNVQTRSRLLADIKIRHFFLHAKAQADLARRPGRPSGLSDSDLHELMGYIWLADRLRADPALDVRRERARYDPSHWAGRDVSPDAMAAAASRAFDFYSRFDPIDEMEPQVSR